MKKTDSSAEPRPSKEEIDALLKDMPLFDLKSVRNTLYKRSIRFRLCWVVLMLLTLSYVMGWFSGALLPMMASSFTNLEADYQLHQLRFLIGFLMIAAGTIAINFDRNIFCIFILVARCVSSEPCPRAKRSVSPPIRSFNLRFYC